MFYLNGITVTCHRLLIHLLQLHTSPPHPFIPHPPFGLLLLHLIIAFHAPRQAMLTDDTALSIYFSLLISLYGLLSFLYFLQFNRIPFHPRQYSICNAQRVLCLGLYVLSLQTSLVLHPTLLVHIANGPTWKALPDALVYFLFSSSHPPTHSCVSKVLVCLIINIE